MCNNYFTKILKKYRHFRIQYLFYIIAVIVALVALVFIITHSRGYFNRRIVRQFQSYISSYGSLSPLILVFLIFISTIIPPLPLPIPLIEIAAGLVFGFWPGFFLVWISQIGSSILAFAVTRLFGNRIFGGILKIRIWSFYRQYLDTNGAITVFLTRVIMASPFNIVSYLSGLSKMGLPGFAAATILGTIPESILFPYIGSRLKEIHLGFGYIFTILISVSITGSIISFLILRYLQSNFKNKKYFRKS